MIIKYVCMRARARVCVCVRACVRVCVKFKYCLHFDVLLPKYVYVAVHFSV